MESSFRQIIAVTLDGGQGTTNDTDNRNINHSTENDTDRTPMDVQAVVETAQLASGDCNILSSGYVTTSELYRANDQEINNKNSGYVTTSEFYGANDQENSEEPDRGNGAENPSTTGMTKGRESGSDYDCIEDGSDNSNGLSVADDRNSNDSGYEHIAGGSLNSNRHINGSNNRHVVSDGSDRINTQGAVNGSGYSLVNGNDQNGGSAVVNRGYDVVNVNCRNSGYDVANGSDQNNTYDVINVGDQKAWFDIANGSDQNSGYDVVNGSDQNSRHDVENGSDRNSGCDALNDRDQNNGHDFVNSSYRVSEHDDGSNQNGGHDSGTGRETNSPFDENTGSMSPSTQNARNADRDSTKLRGTVQRHGQDLSSSGLNSYEKKDANDEVNGDGYDGSYGRENRDRHGANGSEHNDTTDVQPGPELRVTCDKVEETHTKNIKANGIEDVPEDGLDKNGYVTESFLENNNRNQATSNIPVHPVSRFQAEPHEHCQLSVAEGNESSGGTASSTCSRTSESIHREYQARYSQNSRGSSEGSSSLTVHCHVANNSDTGTATSSSVGDGVSSVSLGAPPDRIYFLDARTFEKPLKRPGPRIHYSLVISSGDWAEKGVQELLDELCQTKDEKKRSAIHQVILVKRLPQLAVSGSLSDVARVLPIVDGSLQSAASSKLLSMLLDLRHRKEASLTEELLSVVQITQTTILEQDDDNTILYELACLHLMAASALLTRCPKPKEDQCKSFLLSPKQLKMHAIGGAKSTVLKALQVFYEHFKDQMERSSCFPVWSNLDWTDKSRKARKEAHQRASFCELVVYAFTFLNEISLQGWNPSGETLISGLADLYDSVPRAGQKKHREEAVFVLQFLLLRGVVFLLNTVFNKDKPKFGSRNCVHVSSMSELAVKLTKGGDATAALLKEVSSLPFHRVTEVRQKFNLLLRTYEHWLTDLTLGHLEHCLQSVGFCRTPKSSAQVRNSVSRDDCFWNEVDAFLGGKPVEGVIYVPRAACMANVPLQKCMNEHPGLREEEVNHSIQLAEDAERHKNNFNNLLQLSPRSQHVIQLLALQYDPVPFYVTEAVEGHRLLMHLLECRHAKSWLPMHTILAAARDHIVPALLFLESHDMVSRDVTAYNMVVYGLEGTEKRRENVFSGRFIIKLVDLGLTHKYKDNGNIRPVRHPGPIPTRWTCQNALSTGEYTPAAMVFSMGCVLYEMATHGLQPFTSYDATDTEDFDTKRFLTPSNVKLNQWACIPDSVNDLIQQCTDPEPSKRPSLAQVQQQLTLISAETFPDVTSEHDLDAALGWDKKYSEPCHDQVKRNHVPRKGIPAPVKQLIAAGKTSKLYVNTRKSNWFTTNHVAVTEAEFYTSDWVHFEYKGDSTVVIEKVSPKFVQDVLPSIEAAQVKGVKSWHTASLKSGGGHHLYERIYPRGMDLKTAAAMNFLREDIDPIYSTPEEDSAVHVRVFLALAHAVRDLHYKGLLLRSLRAAHVLLTENEVILPRVGRIYQLTSSDHCHDGPFQDIYRWLSPEVLLSDKYGRENDVFLLVTVFWETMRIMELSARDPAATDIHFAPFADILKTQVVHVVRENTPLPCPEGCEDWLYDLILKGRHHEPGHRPTAQEVMDTLTRRLRGSGHDGPFIYRGNQKPKEQLTKSTTESNVPPQLPPRNYFQGVRNQTSSIPVLSRANTGSMAKDSEETMVKRPAGPTSERRNRDSPGETRTHTGYHENMYHTLQHTSLKNPPTFRPPPPRRNTSNSTVSLGGHRQQRKRVMIGLRNREMSQATTRSRERLSGVAKRVGRADAAAAVGDSSVQSSRDTKKQDGQGPEVTLRASRQDEKTDLPVGAQSSCTHNIGHAEQKKTYIEGSLCRPREAMYLPSAAQEQKHPKLSPEFQRPGNKTETELGYQEEDSIPSSLPSTTESGVGNDCGHLNCDCRELANGPNAGSTAGEKRELPADTKAAEQTISREARAHVVKNTTESSAALNVFVVDPTRPRCGYILTAADAENLKERRNRTNVQFSSGDYVAMSEHLEVSHGVVTGLHGDVYRDNKLYESDSASSAASDRPCDDSRSMPTVTHSIPPTRRQPPSCDQGPPSGMSPRHESHDLSIYLHPIPDPNILKTCYQNEIPIYPDTGLTPPHADGVQTGVVEHEETVLVGNEVTACVSTAGWPHEIVRRGTSPGLEGESADQAPLPGMSRSACREERTSTPPPVVSNSNGISQGREAAERRKSHQTTGTSGGPHHGRRASRIPRPVSAPMARPGSAAEKTKHIPGVEVGLKTKIHRKPPLILCYDEA